MVILLYNGNVGHVLKGYAVPELLCARLKGDVSKFCPVYEDTGLYAGAVTEGKAPVVSDACDGCFKAHFHSGLTGHIG